MPQFIVRFFKTVTDDTGHDIDANQAVMRIKAKDADEALILAQLEFCSDRQIGDWRVNADRVVASESGREL